MAIGGLNMLVWLAIPMLLCVGAMAVGGKPRPPEQLSTLDNGTLRVGVDLSLGGVISYLGRSGEAGFNIINSHDWGRQVQQSYYSGPRPFGEAHPGWKGWCWNPIGTGDAYGNPAKVLEHTNDGQSMYVRSQPMQWALNNVPGDCTFESWIRLDGPVVHVRCRLTNRRSDTTQYQARGQELPAVYTIGKLYRLFTYIGDQPYTGQPPRQIANAGPPWEHWEGTEHWAALVGDDGWGLGVMNPEAVQFTGGFHDTPNIGGSLDNPTGYIAPITVEVLDHNVVFDYEYDLIVGTLDEIRRYVYEHRPAEPTMWRFDRDRRHWTYVGGCDSGWPIQGQLCLIDQPAKVQMLGPQQFVQAEQAGTIVIEGAWMQEGATPLVHWRRPGSKDWLGPVAIKVIGDGVSRRYTAKLAGHPEYSGALLQLRLQPLHGLPGTGSVRISSISLVQE